MRLIYHLIKLGFFNLRTWFFIIKAQRIHGRNLSLLLKYASDKFGDKIAISDEENTLTFSVLSSTYQLV